MARGWESKSVESQIGDAGSLSDQGQPFDAAQRRIHSKRQGIELSRRRVLRELEAARSAVRRSSLEQALAFLDKELEELPES